MKQGTILQIAYTLFIGILLTVFVGVGITAFYKAPANPTYPRMAAPVAIDAKQTALQLKEQNDFDIKQKAFEDANHVYHRNTSIVALLSALFFLILGVSIFKKGVLLSDGFLLGGTLTLLYSVIEGFNSKDDIFRFVVVTVVLLVVLFVGHKKLSKSF